MKPDSSSIVYETSIAVEGSSPVVYDTSMGVEGSGINDPIQYDVDLDIESLGDSGESFDNSGLNKSQPVVYEQF